MLQIAKVDWIWIINCKYLHTNITSSHPEVFCAKDVLKKFTENHYCQSLFLINCRPQACNSIKKETLAQVFSYEFCKIFKKTFFIEHIQWLFSEYVFFWTVCCTLSHSYFLWNISNPLLKMKTPFQQKELFLTLPAPHPLATSSKPHYLAALLFLIQLKAERK